MVSPLSGLLACIYLVFLESSSYKYITPYNSDYFRYIEHILLFYPKELDLIKITRRLNKIEPTVKFIHELETNNSLLIKKMTN